VLNCGGIGCGRQPCTCEIGGDRDEWPRMPAACCNWCRWSGWTGNGLACERGVACRPGLHWCPHYEREPGADDDR
jgi:hypothetical protein